MVRREPRTGGAWMLVPFLKTNCAENGELAAIRTLRLHSTIAA
jgi:hypothetical protein